jgi:hypothetical protein
MAKLTLLFPIGNGLKLRNSRKIKDLTLYWPGKIFMYCKVPARSSVVAG